MADKFSPWATLQLKEMSPEEAMAQKISIAPMTIAMNQPLSPAAPPIGFKPNKVVDTLTVKQKVPSAPPPPDSPEAQMEKMYLESIQSRKADVQKAQDALGALGEKPSGFQNMDLSPLAALVDSWTGSSLSQGYRAPTVAKEWEAKKALLQKAYDDQRGALTGEQMEYLKLQAAKQKNDEAMELRRMMMSMRGDRAHDTDMRRMEFKLRDEWRNDPVTKASKYVASAFERIQTVANDPSPAGDLALIFNYMKMLDPGSTVREGEFATAQNSGSVPDNIRNWYNKVLTGKRLGEEGMGTRQDFLNQAANLYRSQTARQKTHDDYYSRLASESGVPVDRVVAKELFNPPQQQAGLSPDEDAKALKWAKENPHEPMAQEILRANGVQ